MKMKLEPNRETCGPIKEISEVAKELHSPTKEHVCEYFHSREQGKYNPVHHPFHLKGHSHRQSDSPSFPSTKYTGACTHVFLQIS